MIPPRPTTRNLIWLRVEAELPDDPLLHVCLITYASDMTLLDSVLTGHGLSWLDGRTSGASLDHAMRSTGRSGPTGGCSTRRTRRWPTAAAAWRTARCSRPRASWWCRSCRRA